MIKRIFAFILLSQFAFAQSAGSTGLSFLKNGIDARTIGSGDIGFLDSDPSAVYYNPAAINNYRSETVMFTHQAWIQDISSQIFNANFTLIGLPFSLGLNSTSISGFEVRTKPSDTPDANFDVNYFSGSLTTGFSLNEEIKFGITIKYLYESLLSDDAVGMAYDFGLIYNELVDNLTIGASIRNLGSMEKLRNEKTNLPSNILLNAVYEYEIDRTQFEIIPVAGIVKYFDQDNIHIHSGAEISYQKQFTLRFGYLTGYEAKGFSTGLGISWNSLNINYAYTPFSYALGNANTFSIMYQF